MFIKGVNLGNWLVLEKDVYKRQDEVIKHARVNHTLE